MLTFVLVGLGLLGPVLAGQECENLNIESEWNDGLVGNLVFTPDHDASGSWTMHLTFDNTVTELECWQATVSTSDSKTFTLTGTQGFAQGQGELHFVSHFSSRAYLVAADIDGQNVCDGVETTTTTTTPPTTTTTTEPPTTTEDPDGCFHVVEIEDDDGTKTPITIDLTPAEDIDSWEVIIFFTESVDSVTSTFAEVTGSADTWTLTNMADNGEIAAGETVKLDALVDHGGLGFPGFEGIVFNGEPICNDTIITTPTIPTTTTTAPDLYHPDHPAKYPYGEVVEASLLFYEAQRSGPLPDDNRVPWRQTSTMDDEILGGYFDAGDHPKFGFPMASFTTIIAWGGINFRLGYEKAEQVEWLKKCIKWSTDYFIGCHVGEYEFIGQIGDGDLDHAYWGRPEDMTMDRPSFRITAEAPGSELAGETAAALAASSIFFRSVGEEEYADECLEHAKKLFEFADKYRGDYTDAIPAEDFYNDWGGYMDELAWGAAWVAKATNDPADLAKAEEMWAEADLDSSSPGEISWDDKTAMVYLAMYELTGEDKYKAKAEEFLSYILSADKTPQGMVWIPSSDWGSLRYASNLAMFAVQAVYSGINQDEAFAFAEGQMNYILGDTGRSYVVGWGNNPPTHAHHRAASCPDRPAPCDWTNKDSPDPNPQILTGALVGGPDRNDVYIDDRNNFAMTEVADDYNAGFQTTLAALNAMFD